MEHSQFTPATSSPVEKESLHSYHPHSDVNAQTNQKETSIDAYRQNGELSSKDCGSLQTEEALSQLDLSKWPAGTRIVQVGPPMIVDIPDSYLEALRNSLTGTDMQPLDDTSDEDLVKFRKEQLSYLIGRPMPDDIQFPQTKSDR